MKYLRLRISIFAVLFGLLFLAASFTPSLIPRDPLLQGILSGGGMLIRNASGAISLAYVAGGRYIGFVEEHMNAWDCLAGQLLIEEAGGRVEDQDADEVIRNGGRIIGGPADVSSSCVGRVCIRIQKTGQYRPAGLSGRARSIWRSVTRPNACSASSAAGARLPCI